MALGITWEVLAEDGAPQVGITVTGVTGTQDVTVEVSWDGGETWLGVRGAQSEPVSGSDFFRDFVPPLNVPVIYRATTATETAVSAADTVPSDTAWVQDPLAPRGAIPVATFTDADGAVRLVSGSASQVVRSQAVDLATVQGSAFPVASVGVRQKPSGVPLVLRPLLDLAADQGALVKAVRRLFETAGQVVLRGLPDEYGLDPVAHVIAPDLVESPSVGSVLGYREWRLTATQVRPQALHVVVPWWSYDDVKAIVEGALGSGATYDDVTAAMPPGTTYVDVLRSPHLLIGGV